MVGPGPVGRWAVATRPIRHTTTRARCDERPTRRQPRRPGHRHRPPHRRGLPAVRGRLARGAPAARRGLLGRCPPEGRAALPAELEALDGELRQADSGDRAVAIRPDRRGAEHRATWPAHGPRPRAWRVPRSTRRPRCRPVTRPRSTSDHPRRRPMPRKRARVRYFGDCEIESELARAGMGVVFRARQIRLNRPVALKTILAGQLADATEAKRFYTVAEATANLDHSLPPTALPWLGGPPFLPYSIAGRPIIDDSLL